MKNRIDYSRLFQRVVSLIVLAGALAGVLPVVGQTRPAATKPAPNTGSQGKSPVGQSGGWSGIITYTKTLEESSSSDEPVMGYIDKVRNRVRHQRSRNYRYEGRVVVTGASLTTQAVTRAKVSLTDEERDTGYQVVIDSCHAFNDEHEFIDQSSDNATTKASAEGTAQGFFLYPDERAGNYRFSFRFPDAQGTYTREQRVTHKGYCQPKNNEPYQNSTNQQEKVDGESVSIEGKFDPKNPDIIEGSKSWGGEKSGGIPTHRFTVTWRLTRKPPKLMITDLRFEDMKFPNWNDWQEIVEQIGTTDGNLVKIKAKVANLSDETKFADVSIKETYKGDKWDGAKPDAPLKDGEASIRLEAGEEREVELIWDSEGYAWYDDGRPRSVQRIKAEVREGGQLKDEMTRHLQVAPKPLIVVQGIFSDPQSFEPWQNFLTESHSYHWRAYITGLTSPITGKDIGGRFNRSVYDNADELARYIKNARTESNSWHVDVVAHSTGGLIARVYVHKQDVLPDERPVVKHLMMFGTPNNGLSCDEVLNNGSGPVKDNPQTMKDLSRENIALFNQYVKDRKGTRFSALVGNALPSLCPGNERNDGFVGVESATLGITDFAFTKDGHVELTHYKHFWEFVKPHAITGPKGTYPLAFVSDTGGKDGRSGN